MNTLINKGEEANLPCRRCPNNSGRYSFLKGREHNPPFLTCGLCAETFLQPVGTGRWGWSFTCRNPSSTTLTRQSRFTSRALRHVARMCPSSDIKRAAFSVIFLPLNYKLCTHACVRSHCSCVRLFAALWTVARFLSTGFSGQEHWRESPCRPPEDLPDPGVEPTSLMSPASADSFFTTGPPGKPKL